MCLLHLTVNVGCVCVFTAVMFYKKFRKFADKPTKYEPVQTIKILPTKYNFRVSTDQDLHPLNPFVYLFAEGEDRTKDSH